LAGLASLAIPGLGVFLVAGPLAVALGDAIAGVRWERWRALSSVCAFPIIRLKQYEEALVRRPKRLAGAITDRALADATGTRALMLTSGAGAKRSGRQHNRLAHSCSTFLAMSLIRLYLFHCIVRGFSGNDLYNEPLPPN
jgi:hypothetical protein